MKARMFAVLFVAKLASVSAVEDPPNCSLSHGGAGSVSQGGLNFNLAQAHVGDTVQVFASLGKVTNSCKAINATGAVYIATGLLTNFLVDATLNPGVLVVCPANALCQPGPYNLTITPALVGAAVNTPLGGAPGVAKTVRAAENGTGSVLSGDINDQFTDFHTASIQIVTPCIQVIKTCDFQPGQTCFPIQSPVRFRGYVTNCGDITLTNVTVVDDRAGQMQLFNPASGLALTNNVILPSGAYVVFSNSFQPTPQETLAGSATDGITATGRDATTISGPLASVTNSYSATCGICAQPTVIFDNLSVPVNFWVSVSGLFYQAQSFRMGGTDLFLSSVSLNLYNHATATPFPILVQIYDGLHDGHNPPAGLVATLLGPVNPGTGVSIYTPSTSTALLANRTYWISAYEPGAYVSGQTDYDWSGTDGEPTVGPSSGANTFYAQFGRWIGFGDPAGSLMIRVEGIRGLPPQLAILPQLANTNFQFTVAPLIPGKTVLIQVSSNFSDWTPISTNLALTTVLNFTDFTPMTNTVRFYRVVELP